MKRHEWSVLAIATAILIAIAIGCVRKVSKERVWRNGEWVTKEVGR